MKSIFTLLFTLATVFCNAQSWNPVGTAAFSAGNSPYTSLAFSGTTPYVAFVDFGNGGKVTIMKYNGSNWINVGTAFLDAGVLGIVDINLVFSGTTPYVSYIAQYMSAYTPTVKMFNGTSWVDVGPAGGFNTGLNYYLSMAFNGTTPYVAFTDGANLNKATVKMFNGSNWVTVGTAGFSAGQANFIKIAINGTTPYVAYADNANSGRGVCMKFNGTTWVAVGSAIGFTTSIANEISVAVNSSTTYVAFQDGAVSNKASVMQFNGTSWVNVGAAGFSAGAVSYVSLAFSGTTPYVAYRDAGNGNKASVMQFNGTSWVNVGAAGFSAGGATSTSLAFNSTVPNVAYQDAGNSGKVTVMQFSVVLPLQLLSFSGTKTNSGNLLQWKTADEVNTKEYIIERGDDGQNFTAIATVAAKGFVSNVYSYTDAVVSQRGKLYYRLKMVDIGGKLNYSNSISLAVQQNNKITMYPNPAKDITTIQIGDNKLLGTQISITAISGTLLYKKTITSSFEILDVKVFPNGIYLVHFADGTVQKLIKE